MKKTIMIKRKYEFKKLFSKGKFFYGDFVNMYLLSNNKKYNKLAVTVTKRQGKAVDRNRFKRLIKENYRTIEQYLKSGYNILFIINKEKTENTRQISFYDIRQDMLKLFKNSGILNEENID